MGPILKDNQKIKIEPPQGATKEIVLDSGKTLFFRDAKMSDQKEASRFATDDKNKVNPQVLMEEFLRRLFVGLYRANGEKIDPINLNRLFDDDEYFTYQEASQLLNFGDEIIEAPDPEKKTKNSENSPLLTDFRATMRFYAYICRYSANSIHDIDKLSPREATALFNEIEEIIKGESGDKK